VDNQPYALSFEAADDLAYDAFPYKHSVIGSMDDLGAASLDDAKDFYRRYYAPGNALLAVVGDVDPLDAFRRVKKAFAEVPARETPPRFAFEEPVPTGERRLAVSDKHAAMPGLHVNFKVGERRQPDSFALSVVERVLSAGESGRMWRRLVKDESLALSLSVSLDERRGPSLFRVFALARPGVTLERLEAEILLDFERFAADGPTAREMERSRRMVLASAVRATQTTAAIAFLLSEYGVYDGDPGLFPRDVEAVLALDAATVREAAARLLVAERRSVVTVVPQETREAA